MGSHREVGGVALAFTGFAFLVLAFKGTWHNVWAAALGQGTPASSSSSSSSKGTTAAAGFPGSAPGSGAGGVPRVPFSGAVK